MASTLHKLAGGLALLFATTLVQAQVEERTIKRLGTDVGRAGPPPVRRRFPVMKADPAEQSRIAKDERAPGLSQDAVVMFFRPEVRNLGAQLPGHAEMKTDPIAAGEFEEHLLSPSKRAEKTAPGQFPFQRARIRAAEDSLPRVKLDRDHLLPEARVPLPPKKFYLGQFRHWAI